MRGNLYIKSLIIFFLLLAQILSACGSDDGRHVRDVNAPSSYIQVIELTI